MAGRGGAGSWRCDTKRGGAWAWAWAWAWACCCGGSGQPGGGGAGLHQAHHGQGGGVTPLSPRRSRRPRRCCRSPGGGGGLPRARARAPAFACGDTNDPRTVEGARLRAAQCNLNQAAAAVRRPAPLPPPTPSPSRRPKFQPARSASRLARTCSKVAYGVTALQGTHHVPAGVPSPDGLELGFSQLEIKFPNSASS